MIVSSSLCEIGRILITVLQARINPGCTDHAFATTLTRLVIRFHDLFTRSSSLHVISVHHVLEHVDKLRGLDCFPLSTSGAC